VSSLVPIAVPAINTLLRVGNGTSPEFFTTIAYVNSITGPSLQGQVVDVTSMSTGIPWRQKLVTLLEGGEVNFKVFWQPMVATHQTLLTLFNNRGANGVAGAPIDFQLVFPDQDGSTYYFSGFVSAVKLSEDVADVIKADATITITGQVTYL
jgi:hypothetical protein